MKKYFNWIDCTVFGALILCLIWIYFYKFNWTNSSELLFENADKWADIAYTVVTSIVASGFFYIVTIFLPKIKQIIDMKNGLIYYLKMINSINYIIFSKIRVGNTNVFYNVDTFMVKYLNEKEIACSDFNNAYNSEIVHKLLVQGINTQNDFIVGIMSNYSNILTGKLSKEIKDHICIHSSAIKNLPQNSPLIVLNEESLRVLVHTTGIIYGLRETYNINK